MNDLSEGGGTSSFNVTEVDVWAEYSRSLGPKLTGTLGSVLYLFPNQFGLTNAVNRTVEVYGKVQAGVPLSPKLAAWYDMDKVDGLGVLNLSWSKPLSGPPAAVESNEAPVVTEPDEDGGAAAQGELSGPARTETSEARKLGTLVDVSQALAGTVNLHAGLSGVLAILVRRCGAARGAVALLDEGTRELQVRAGIGLTREGSATRYTIGEGIIGAVAESGEPIVVPEISRDARFLHRAPTRRERRDAEFSFVCVPVLLHRRPVGTLSIELPHKPDREYGRLLKFLRIVASMICWAPPSG